MECTINWMPANGMAFSAETASGHVEQLSLSSAGWAPLDLTAQSGETP